MKILLISDNHLTPGLAKAMEREQADLSLHMGDSQFKKDNKEMIGFDYAIQGNCDFEKYPEHQICEVGNDHWLLFHGYQVYNAHDLEAIAAYAKTFKCQVVCYGHTHVPVYSKVDGVIILNPGSFARSRTNYPNSYMTVEIKDDQWRVQLKYANNGSLIKEFKLNE
ncbi:YfcE family phosphodiesterase [Mollicutes bacterium LVI A0039]|nr:YfcE family phosphodiesterase [Mollicutes bacterium LVI A0039]